MTRTSSSLPKVSVCVITYNQVGYLATCLQSIVDQKTNFSFEIIVGDDCSTDGTQKILRAFAARYKEIIRPIYQTVNTGGGPNHIAVHAAARGDYIAHIDGDDYALPGKLQKQADYLDAHPECNIVWHRVGRQRDGEDPCWPKELGVVKPLYFTKGDCLALGSVAVHSSKMYRASLRVDYFDLIKYQYDYELDLLQIGDRIGTVLPDILGVYRIVGGGLSSISHNPSWRMLNGVLAEYYQSEPHYRGQVSSLLLMLAIVDVKNRRAYKWLSIKNYISNFSVSSVYYLFKYARRRRQLRDWMRT
ncbi:MAG: glycosyltransferase family 2 protein [Limnobacter sp.]